jgi:hypothetical protein
MFVAVDRCRMAFSSEYAGSSHQLRAASAESKRHDHDPLRLPASLKHFDLPAANKVSAIVDGTRSWYCA